MKASSSVVTINASARTKAIDITGNTKNNSIVGGSGNDTLNGGAGDDTLTGGAGKDVFVYASGAGNDVIADFTAGQDTLKLSSGTISGYSFSGNDAILTIGKGTVKILGGKNNAVTVVDSKKKTFTYQNGLIQDNSAVAKAKAVTVTAANSGTIKASDYGAAVVSIDASSRTDAVNITGNTKNNKIIGSSGNDTISGNSGKNTLTGGKGNDLFIYSGGNDVITDYTSGDDTIQIASGAISSYSVSGKDVSMKIGKNTLKVTGGKTSTLTILDAENNVNIYQSGLIYNNEIASATTLSVTSAYGNTLSSYGANVKTIDASTKNKAIKITGNAKDNSIVGSAKNDTIDGGAGADTLYGGKGNDVLTGGAGNDIFIYTDGDGKDTITDYSAGDYNISYSYSSAKGGTSTFKIGKSGSIAVKNSANAVVTLIGANGEASIGIKNNFLAVKDIPGFSQGSGTNETVYVTMPAETVNVTMPAETITVYSGEGGGSVISGTSGADILYGTAGNDTISGDNGKDTIDAGKGDDIIIGDKGNDLLTGGKGDDIFYFGGADGNDTIMDYSAGDIISVGGAVTYSTKNSDAILKIGTGNVTLQNAAGMAITIVGAEKIASIYSGKNITTETYIGKVTIPSDAIQYNGHSYYIFDSGTTWDEAKAYAEELGGHLVAITDASEQNAIENLLAAHFNAKNSYWMGGYRDDKLGWQWITGENWDYTSWGYGQPDGDLKNDVLCDALMMYYSSANGWHLGDWNDFFRDGVNGQDFFGVENFGYIVEWDTIISSATGTDTVYVTLPAETVNVTMPAETINVTMPAETVTVGGNDETVYVTVPADTVTVYSGEGGGSVIKGTSGADILYGTAGNDTISLGAGKDIYVYSGGNDYDVITDYKEGADRISLDGATFNGGLVVGNDVLMAVGGGMLKLVNAKYSKVTLVSGGIETEYVNAVKSGTGADGVTVTLEADRKDAFSLSAYNSTVDKKAGNIDGSLVKNSISIYGDDENNIILAGKAGSSIWAGKGNDIIHGGAGNDTIYYWSNGGNDTIYDYKSGDQIRMRRVDEDDTTTFKNFSVSGNDVIINYTNGSTITLKDAGDQQINLRELDYNTSWYSYDTSYYSTFGYVTISGGTATLNKKYDGYFRPSMYSENPATVDASAVTTLMTIYGDDRANLIKASKGGSSIWAGKGNDTIYGGAGNDTIFYWSNEGNKTIYDYKTGDGIRMRRVDEDDTTTFKNFTVTDNDVVINFTNGSKITLKDAGDQRIYLGEFNYDAYYASTYYNSTFGYVTISGGTATLNKKYQGNCATSYYANVTNIDASNVTVSTNLYGDGKANVIHAGKAGGSISAGAGNDTVYFGDGRDTLIFYSGDGNDTIYNIGNNDAISLSGCSAESVSVKGSDVIITTDDKETITLKEATGKSIYISGKGTQTYSSVASSADIIDDFWFTEDDTNFAVGGEIDSIIDNSNSLANLNFNPVDSNNIFAQDEPQITFTNDK